MAIEKNQSPRRPGPFTAWLVGLGCLIVLVGCGRKAAPQPPEIRVAERTQDLTVFQEGAEAVLTWSYPSSTTAGGPLPDVDSVSLWRASIPQNQEPVGTSQQEIQAQLQLLLSQGDQLSVLNQSALEKATRGSSLVVRDDLFQWYQDSQDRGPLVVWYAVRTTCCGGAVSEFSNLARLIPQGPPAAPEGISASATESGIEISWSPIEEQAVLVERSTDGKQWQAVTSEPVKGDTWRDSGARQGSKWYYRLRAVRAPEGVRIVGDAGSEVAEVDYLDVYPPAPPENLVCLPEGGRVRLRWLAAAESESYRIYRQLGDAKWVHLKFDYHQLEYYDTEPPRGNLRYAVRTVDAAGNESLPSECTTVVGRVP